MTSTDKNSEQVINDYLFRVYSQVISRKISPFKILDISSFWEHLYQHYFKQVSDGVDRNYHDISHIVFGIDELSKILPEQSIDEVIIAWLYHDSILKVGSNIDNELESAWFSLESLLEIGWKGIDAGRVFDLILLTKHKENPPENDYQARLIVDIDLLPLSITPQNAFFESTRKVRTEYKNFTEEEFIKGRLDFWKNFLKLKGNRIYRTNHYKDRNQIALDNIEKEMFSLERGKII